MNAANKPSKLWGRQKCRVALHSIRIQRALDVRIGKQSCQTNRFFNNRLNAFYGYWEKK